MKIDLEYLDNWSNLQAMRLLIRTQIEEVGLESGHDRVPDNRATSDRRNVLAGNALAAAQRRDDRESHRNASRRAVTIRSWSASDRVAYNGKESARS